MHIRIRCCGRVSSFCISCDRAGCPCGKLLLDELKVDPATGPTLRGHVAPCQVNWISAWSQATSSIKTTSLFGACAVSLRREWVREICRTWTLLWSGVIEWLVEIYLPSYKLVSCSCYAEWLEDFSTVWKWGMCTLCLCVTSTEFILCFPI